MTYVLSSDYLEVISPNDDQEIDQKFFSDLIQGEAFDTEDELEEYITSVQNKYNVVFDSYCFTEAEDEVDVDAEWDDTIRSALAESEETGQPFDHIMGEILGGVR